MDYKRTGVGVRKALVQITDLQMVAISISASYLILLVLYFFIQKVGITIVMPASQQYAHENLSKCIWLILGESTNAHCFINSTNL